MVLRRTSRRGKTWCSSPGLQRVESPVAAPREALLRRSRPVRAPRLRLVRTFRAMRQRIAHRARLMPSPVCVASATSPPPASNPLGNLAGELFARTDRGGCTIVMSSTVNPKSPRSPRAPFASMPAALSPTQKTGASLTTSSHLEPPEPPPLSLFSNRRWLLSKELRTESAPANSLLPRWSSFRRAHLSSACDQSDHRRVRANLAPAFSGSPFFSPLR